MSPHIEVQALTLNSLQNPVTRNVTQSIVRVSNSSVGLNLRLQIILNAYFFNECELRFEEVHMLFLGRQNRIE